MGGGKCVSGGDDRLERDNGREGGKAAFYTVNRF